MQFTVKPIWKDQTCVILAGGPSLRGFNFDEEIGGNCKNFITINDSWRLLPSGTKAINYFCDHAWWSMQLQKIQAGCVMGPMLVTKRSTLLFIWEQSELCYWAMI